MAKKKAAGRARSTAKPRSTTQKPSAPEAATRPGHVRRSLRNTVGYQGTLYGPGEHIEVPDGLAASIDSSMTNPDASKELARAGGKGAEDDAEAQGKKIREAADPERLAEASRKNRQNNPAFELTPEPKRSEGAKRRK